MATTTADERSGWGFWRILGLFVLIVLAVLVALYFYNPTELKRVGNDAMDHARSYKRTIVSDYDRFYQCMRGGGATTVAAVEQVDRPSARPRSPEAGPIVVYPPYPEYPAYPAYPEMPAGSGQDMPAGPSGQGMPPGADMGGMPPHAVAPGMQTYPGYPRAPDYPQPPTGPQGPSGAMYRGPAGTMEPGPQGAMPSPGRFQGPGGYDMPPPGMQQRWPGMPGMRMPGPPGGRTWQAQPAPPSFGPGSGGQIMAQPGPGMRPSMGTPTRPMPPQPGPYHERPMGSEGPGSGPVPGGMTSPTGFGPQAGPPAAWMAGAQSAVPQSAAPMPPMREMPVPAQREPAPVPQMPEAGLVPPQDMGQAAAPAATPPVGMIVIPGPSSSAPVPHSVPPAQAAAPMPQPAPQVPAFAPAPAEMQSPQPGQPARAAAAPLAPAPATAQAPQPPQAAYGPSEPPLDPQIAAARQAYGRQQIQDSIRTYREYINTHHDSAMAFGELGNVLLAAGRPQEAAQAYYEASARLIDMGQPGNVYLLLPLIEQHDPLLAAVITRRLAALPRSYY